MHRNSKCVFVSLRYERELAMTVERDSSLNGSRVCWTQTGRDDAKTRRGTCDEKQEELIKELEEWGTDYLRKYSPCIRPHLRRFNRLDVYYIGRFKWPGATLEVAPQPATLPVLPGMARFFLERKIVLTNFESHTSVSSSTKAMLFSYVARLKFSWMCICFDAILFADLSDDVKLWSPSTTMYLRNAKSCSSAPMARSHSLWSQALSSTLIDTALSSTVNMSKISWELLILHVCVWSGAA